MAFRSIGDLAIEVLAGMNGSDGSGAADYTRPARSTAGKATTKTLREGKPWPSMLREEGAATAIEMGKVASTEAPAEFFREEIKLRSEAQWARISASLFTANRNKRVAPPTRFAPALATRLFLVVNRVDHASSPTRRVAR